MTPEHVAEILTALGASYRQEVTGDMAEIWFEHFADVPDEVATAAVALVLREEVYFPSPAVVRKFIPAARREIDAEEVRRSHGPPPVCSMCDGEGWYPGRAEIGEAFPRTTYEAIRPCSSCAPVQFDRWRRYVADQAARRRIRPPEDFDFDPTPMLAETRRALKALADSMKTDEEDDDAATV